MMDAVFETDLEGIFFALQRAAERISNAIGTTDLGKAGTINASGEDQIALDVQSDRIVQEELKESGGVGFMASEEMEDALRLEGGRFAVVFDPLDGSSLVDVNLSIGTIFGVYEGDEVIGRTGREMVAAGFVVYGPRTTLVWARPGLVKEYRLQPDGAWVCSRDNLRVGEGKLFAPGNLRAASEREDYFKLVEWWMKEGYTLRYSGGMVPDVNQILLKGKGIFSYPGYSEAPQGKLRLLYECAPMAYVMEQAGGAASDGHGPILDKVIESLHQRTPIYVGSRQEVSRCEEWLG